MINFGYSKLLPSFSKNPKVYTTGMSTASIPSPPKNPPSTTGWDISCRKKATCLPQTATQNYNPPRPQPPPSPAHA